MSLLEYDRESDSIYINLSSKKAYLTLEVSERVGIDATEKGVPVGVEILEASSWLSSVFNKTISKEQMRKLLCKFSLDGDTIDLDFALDKKHVKVTLPKPYYSPVLFF